VPPSARDVERNLARVRVGVAAVIAVSELATAPDRVVMFVVGSYCVAALLTLFAVEDTRRSLPRLALPIVDLGAAVALTLTSHLWVVHFFALFVLVATAVRTGVAHTAISGLVLAASLVFESAATFDTLGDAPALGPHLFVLAGYTVVAAILIGHLATRARGARSESAAIGRLFEHVRLDAGPVTSIRTLLDELRTLHGASEVLLAVDERTEGLSFLWRSRCAGFRRRAVERLTPEARARYWFPLDRRAGACLLVPIGSGLRIATALDEAGRRMETPTGRVDAFAASRPFERLFVLPQIVIGDFRLRLFVLGPAVERAEEELGLLMTLARRTAPVIHNLYLERHLRTRLREDERARLAHELHDGVIQSLIAIEMRLDVAKRQVATTPAAVVGDIEEAQRHLRSQIVDVRTLMHQLRPPQVGSQRLLERLSESTERFTRATGIEATFVRDVNRVDLPPRVGGELVRVVDEALMNVRKHSGARHVNVRVGESSEALTLSIEDDGRGFGFDGRLTGRDLVAQGLGPIVIQERVSALGGRVAIDSLPGRGTRVEVQVPRPIGALSGGLRPLEA
jgi:signal transduction histidine kinase